MATPSCDGIKLLNDAARIRNRPSPASAPPVAHSLAANGDDGFPTKAAHAARTGASEPHWPGSTAARYARAPCPAAPASRCLAPARAGTGVAPHAAIVGGCSGCGRRRGSRSSSAVAGVHGATSRGAKNLDRPAMPGLFQETTASTMVRPEPMTSTVDWGPIGSLRVHPKDPAQRRSNLWIRFAGCAPPGTCRWPLPQRRPAVARHYRASTAPRLHRLAGPPFRHGCARRSRWTAPWLQPSAAGHTVKNPRGGNSSLMGTCC